MSAMGADHRYKTHGIKSPEWAQSKTPVHRMNLKATPCVPPQMKMNNDLRKFYDSMQKLLVPRKWFWRKNVISKIPYCREKCSLIFVARERGSLLSRRLGEVITSRINPLLVLSPTTNTQYMLNRTGTLLSDSPFAFYIVFWGAPALTGTSSGNN